MFVEEVMASVFGIFLIEQADQLSRTRSSASAPSRHSHGSGRPTGSRQLRDGGCLFFLRKARETKVVLGMQGPRLLRQGVSVKCSQRTQRTLRQDREAEECCDGEGRRACKEAGREEGVRPRPCHSGLRRRCP